jgi:acetolactate synthase-1/3 small subunit
MERNYTLTIFSENKTGVLLRVVGIITRRHINIESMTVSPSSIEGIHRFTVSVTLDEERVKKLVAQIESGNCIIQGTYRGVT